MNAIAVAAGVILLAVAVLGVVAYVLDSRRQWVLVAAALAPWLMAAAIPATVLFAATGSWAGVEAAAMVLVAAVATQWRLFARRRRASKQVVAGERELVVMQANVWVGQADSRALIEAVRTNEVDVLTVSELTPDGLDDLIASGLADELFYSYVSTGPEGYGTGIWSRYPLIDEWRHDGYCAETLSARVCVPEGPRPLVYAVHPMPPWPRQPADWLRELELLRQLLAKIPDDGGPVIISGDFNATFDHKRYRNLLNGRYQDVAVATGAGMLATYPAHKPYPPLIAIDHILVADAQPRSVRTVKLAGSDHRGLVAQIAL